MNSNKKEVDYFRDTPIRYLGYANEVGEAFRSMISQNAVRATYGVAFGYVFLDVIDKARKTYKKENEIFSKLSADLNQRIESPTIKTCKVATDCLIWQSFASVIVPGFTINRVCKFSSILLNKTNINGILRANKIITTLIGLGSIPLIIHPIDNACHYILDKTLRPALGIEPFLKN